MNSYRQTILSLLSGKRVERPPTFSGLISVTTEGLEREGLRFHETHRHADKMARAAASTYRVSGFPSAVVPLDMCVEAEALGGTIDYREGDLAGYPRVAVFLYQNLDEFNTKKAQGTKIEDQGRIPLVCNAFELLKATVGEEIVLGGYLPGPFTLLSLLVETGALYMALRKPQEVHPAMEFLARVLAEVGEAYHRAGADFLTVHEMGGSPGALGPKTFEAVVLPHLQGLFSALPGPVVLSCCGRTNGAMKLMDSSGAYALSVDQTNDLAASREEVPEALIFGNLDPVGTLSQGTPEAIGEAVDNAIRAGVDAVWPGCDLFLQTSLENLQALAATD
jgi:[methyl-Co(III) methanol-specific corrinoid protein]:coenzyme M methyltransferase